ncbi:monothiol glutaredoxin grx5 [Savitreella phatthalungensis]
MQRLVRTPRNFAGLRRSVTRTPLPFFLQSRALSDATRAAIDKAVASKPVVLFMKGTPDAPACGYSRATVKILEMQGVDPQKLTTFNVLADDDLRQGIKEYSEWPTIPQLYVNKEFLGGCDILISMHNNGELEDLLNKENVLQPLEESATTDIDGAKPPQGS